LTFIFDLAAMADGRSLYQQHHQKSQEARYDRQVEDAAHADVHCIKKEDSKQRPEEGARIVADAFESERSASILLIDGRCDECVTRRRAGSGAEPIQQSCPKYTLPCRG
jgi:hypothetical protein